MREFTSFRSKGQTAVLIALMAVALLAFVALAIDGSNAYSLRRDAQSAADGGAIAGTWTMVDIKGFDAVAQILRKVNQYCQDNGVRDTDSDPSNAINGNVLVYYVDSDGNRLSYPELHSMEIVPGDARGVEVDVTITATTFFARLIGQPVITATAVAAARYEPDGGILPIAVNEYWLGSEGKCPYSVCGEPYSFVRDPSQPPPFRTTDGGATWQHNDCAWDSRCCNSYNANHCQGPYEGQGDLFGRAFAMLGGDARPNYGSQNPRSAVELDYRYDAIEDGGYWFYLVGNDTWVGPTSPIADGQGKAAMEEVIKSGGYSKVPLPRALHEPPMAYIDQWGYCWGSPPNNCFNYPKSGRSRPYDTLQFLSGTAASFLARAMEDDGRYVDGRYAPGQRIVIMVYNGFTGDQWGQGGAKNDAAAVVGYFGAIIVGYGNNFEHPCTGWTAGDAASFAHCVKGNPNTTYGLASPSGPLVIDPTKLLNEFLPKKIVLVR